MHGRLFQLCTPIPGTQTHRHRQYLENICGEVMTCYAARGPVPYMMFVWPTPRTHTRNICTTHAHSLCMHIVSLQASAVLSAALRVECVEKRAVNACARRACGWWKRCDCWAVKCHNSRTGFRRVWVCEVLGCVCVCPCVKPSRDSSSPPPSPSHLPQRSEYYMYIMAFRHLQATASASSTHSRAAIIFMPRLHEDVFLFPAVM